MLPSQYPEVASYPHLKHMLQTHVDMQFEDVRVLLGLPTSGSTVGANFATAAVIFNLISGASVAFYQTSSQALAGRGNRGARFKDVLDDHFPLREISLPRQTTIDISTTTRATRSPTLSDLGMPIRKSSCRFPAGRRWWPTEKRRMS